ncbi:MAG: hypothetical protein A2X77_00760 [Gammaproteobacteria bacterium GWE2_42_36]|nr:MAG: hypothetical protein A2X77_00760 [Gammaproteobacteria bacterium GWE2_42_36]HCU05643.1 hypothetical protein [Coxiellaceae bacterium]
MKIFKTKMFHQWAEKIDLTDRLLRQAVEEILLGRYDANLGGGLYKKRIAINKRGKSGSLRTLIAFKEGRDSFFLYGFAKNEKGNIKRNEQEGLKALAKIYFSYADNQLMRAVEVKELMEVL